MLSLILSTPIEVYNYLQMNSFLSFFLPFEDKEKTIIQEEKSIKLESPLNLEPSVSQEEIQWPKQEISQESFQEFFKIKIIQEEIKFNDSSERKASSSRNFSKKRFQNILRKFVKKYKKEGDEMDVDDILEAMYDHMVKEKGKSSHIKRKVYSCQNQIINMLKSNEGRTQAEKKLQSFEQKNKKKFKQLKEIIETIDSQHKRDI